MMRTIQSAINRGDKVYVKDKAALGEISSVSGNNPRSSAKAGVTRRGRRANLLSNVRTLNYDMILVS